MEECNEWNTETMWSGQSLYLGENMDTVDIRQWERLFELENVNMEDNYM